MGYRVKAEDWEIVTPIAERLSTLKEYETLILKDAPQAIDRLRHLLYSWLYESGQKSNFKLMRRGPEQIEILRKGAIKPQVQVVDKVSDFIRDHLVELEDESDVSQRIREAVSGNFLSLEEGTRALTEWQRIYCKV